MEVGNKTCTAQDNSSNLLRIQERNGRRRWMMQNRKRKSRRTSLHRRNRRIPNMEIGNAAHAVDYSNVLFLDYFKF
jgi:hypothetical protein